MAGSFFLYVIYSFSQDDFFLSNSIKILTIWILGKDFLIESIMTLW